MSKIKTVRFINLNYNNNALRVSDETLHMNGESTLLRLDNGGGKTVMVQMMTAPFVHKRYWDTKDRRFSDYFTSPKPTFLMVEWKLEDKAGYLLTGMMVRQNQQVEDGVEKPLEIINFISEYQTQCIRDIHHLPVVEKQKGALTLKSFADCRRLFEGYKKEHPNRFFFYDMNQQAQSKNYFDKLIEYGIHYKEWETIIHRINIEESGLSKLFADCRDEKGLIEKWFLAAVEEKLNHDQNRMKEFQSIMEKYIRSYWNNQTKYKQKGNILRFQEEAEKLQDYIDQYAAADQEQTETLSRILGLREVLTELLQKAESGITEEQQILASLEEQQKRLDYEEASLEYHRHEEEYQKHTQTLKQLKQLCSELKAKQEQCQLDLQIQRCAQMQKHLDEASQNAELKRQQLRICKEESADLRPEQDYLGYLLRQDAETKLEQAKAAYAATEREIEGVQRRYTECRNLSAALNEKIGEQARSIGKLETLVANFDKEEDRYFHRWNVVLNRDMMKRYEPWVLPEMAQDLESSVIKQQQEKNRTCRRLADTQNELSRKTRERDEIRTQKENAILEFNEVQKDQMRLEKELTERRSIMRYVEMAESEVYDTEAILSALHAKSAVLRDKVQHLTVEEAALRREYDSLKTGKTMELPPDLAQELEELGIPFLHGMEWLKNNRELSEEDKHSLVRKHPFLPYALMMSKEDWNKLCSSSIRIFTSRPIPVVLRESLNLNQVDEQEEMFPEAQNVRFYMLFNHALLNEKTLAELLAQKKRELKSKQEALQSRQREEQEYHEREYTIQRQTVTEKSYIENRERLSQLKEELSRLEEQKAATDRRLAGLEKQEKELTAEISELEKSIARLEENQKALEEFTSSYEKYLRNQAELEEGQNRLDELKKEKADASELAEKLNRDSRVLEGRRSEQKSEVKEGEEELRKYLDYQEAARPDSLDDTLLRQIELIRARYEAIMRQTSLRVSELQQEYQALAAKQEQARTELNDYATKFNLKREQWAGIRHSIYEEDRLQKEKDDCREQETRCQEQIKDISVSADRAERSMIQTMEKIRTECCHDQPLTREAIQEKDFVAERYQLANAQERHREQEGDWQKKKQCYDRALERLESYQEDSLNANTAWAEFNCPEDEALLKDFVKRLLETHRESVEQRRDCRETLSRQLTKTLQEFEEPYRKTLKGILELIDSPHSVNNQLDTVLRSFRDQMAKIETDLSLVEQEKEQIIGQLWDYLREIHEQLGKIDRNSTIPIRGKPIKMLRIILPKWDEQQAFLRERLSQMIDSLRKNSMDHLKQSQSIHELIGKSLTTRELYDSVVGIGEIRIRLYKIEAQREVSLSWREAAKNSGGEGFLSAFVILSSLLHYMRRDETDINSIRNEGKVLLMDNPFAQTNAPHLLKPLMDVAQKNNTQLICLTGLSGESIYQRFNNIYVLNLVSANLNRGMRYVKSEHHSGKEPEVLELSRVYVMDEEENLSLF